MAQHVCRDRLAPAPNPTPAPPAEAPAPEPAIGGLAASGSYHRGNLFLQSGLFVGQLAKMHDEEAFGQVNEVIR